MTSDSGLNPRSTGIRVCAGRRAAVERPDRVRVPHGLRAHRPYRRARRSHGLRGIGGGRLLLRRVLVGCAPPLPSASPVTRGLLLCVCRMKPHKSRSTEYRAHDRNDNTWGIDQPHWETHWIQKHDWDGTWH